MSNLLGRASDRDNEPQPNTQFVDCKGSFWSAPDRHRSGLVFRPCEDTGDLAVELNRSPNWERLGTDGSQP